MLEVIQGYASDGARFLIVLTDDKDRKVLGSFETEEAAQEAAKVIEADLEWASKANEDY